VIIMRWILVLVLLCGSAARAENFIVNTTIDDTDTIPGNGQCRTVETQCALRAAIQEANALPGPDVITLPAGSYEITTVQSSALGLAGEDAAASGDLDVTSEITITGAAATTTIVEAGGDGTPADRVFHVLAGGDLTLSRVTVRDGRAASSGTSLGGGLYNAGVLELSECLVTNNEANAGGGVFNAGVLRIDACTLSGNAASDAGFTNAQGGAIMSQGGLIEVEITRSTLSGNAADLSGQAIFLNGGTFSAENSTLSGNLGGGDPALTIQNSDVVLTNVTLVENTGEGLNAFSFDETNTLELSNTIVASNGGADCVYAASSPTLSLVNGLSSDASCGFDLENLDPSLGPLADNGGPTRTHRPFPDSPAIDAGAASPVCPDVDQRGLDRPEDGDGDSTADCDIGAVEVPEPGALACAALALGLVGWLARRRP
jgi:CSLREA domain-containing protein